MLNRRRRGAAIAGAVLAGVLTVSIGSSIGQVPPAHAAGLGAGGEYHPLTPARIFDTRSPGNSTSSAIPTSSTGGSVDVHILGQGGIPASSSDVLVQKSHGIRR